MDPRHRQVLRTHRLELSDQLLVSDSIVPFLYQEEILTQDHVEDIESQTTNRRKVLRLLDLLPSRGPHAFQTFLRSLDSEFSWLREKLVQETHLEQTHGPSPTDCCCLSEAVLQKVPSDQELSRLASLLGPEWKSVLLDLGLSVEAVFRCRADHAFSFHEQALAGLVQWRRSEGKKATVQRLVQSLQAAGLHASLLSDVFTPPIL
ncbi:death domain-containing protein CRADD [Thalassophryne amazonica]|uniref:death domain-containing protein CRADD n=1 Tax=Thalassophryne amazonica TaxID=390379 RepID=UPI001471A74A|nr:death domain-containing protein CRADD [Thalassophryne amazonica]